MSDLDRDDYGTASDAADENAWSFTMRDLCLFVMLIGIVVLAAWGLR